MNILLALLYMVVIFILSVINVSDGMDPFRGFDKVVHFFIYAIMGLLWVRVFVKGRRIKNSWRIIFQVLAITFLYGTFIELVQGMIPNRDASLLDALANGLGGVAGVSLYCFFHKYCKISEGKSYDT